MNQRMSRRVVLRGSAGAGAVALLGDPLFAAAATPTPAVETEGGKVRGLRNRGVSTFLGLPYGSDTALRRFQTALPAKPWTGVRDCLQFGHMAPQGTLSFGAAPISRSNNLLMKLFANGSGPEASESEDCLYLNVFTPDASPRRKRPVMVWLHGGGFAQGSGGGAMYDGSALCRRGNVVVVTLNHRLSALGYLYLGDIHTDFLDSGNVGQLDIVLALHWVRDNIAAFGGDASNVTIFGESGGGAKVGTLLGMTPAKGLFHKAIQQSGPVVTLASRTEAAKLADATLAYLNIKNSDVHRLQELEPKRVIEAAIRSQSAGGGLRPLVDGRSVPAHPFDPVATELSRDVPLVIGTNKDEGALFLASDPLFGTMTEAQARERFQTLAGDRATDAYELYRGLRPSDSPTYLVSALMTDKQMRSGSIVEAGRKAAQKAAPVFMYRLDWETPVMGGVLRACHGIDTALVFDNPHAAPGILGTGPDPVKIAADMSQAWVNFAHTGNPSQPGLDWPSYTAAERTTMIFDVPSRLASDPDRERRLFWN